MAHQFIQRAIHRAGEGALPAQARGLVEQVTIKHKICAPHVYSVREDHPGVSSAKR